MTLQCTVEIQHGSESEWTPKVSQHGDVLMLQSEQGPNMAQEPSLPAKDRNVLHELCGVREEASPGMYHRQAALSREESGPCGASGGQNRPTQRASNGSSEPSLAPMFRGEI